MRIKLYSYIIIFLLISCFLIPPVSESNDYIDYKGVVKYYEILDDMYLSVKNCVNNNDTEHPIFHGCIDWHSSVHGHWAIIRYKRITGNDTIDVLNQFSGLNISNLNKERTYLQIHKNFEMPYGRAWFLRLAIDAILLSNGKYVLANLNGMGDDIAESLYNYIITSEIGPMSRDYDNHSWAIVQLHSYYDFKKDNDKLALLNNIIQNKFLNRKYELSFDEDQNNPGFFSRFGNLLYLIIKTQDQNTITKFVKDYDIQNQNINPIDTTAKRPHQLGMNWSRAWALISLANVTKDKHQQNIYLDAYRNHIIKGMTDHRKYKYRMQLYSHWVPQFAIYALTE